MKILKYALIALGGLVVVIGGVFAYVAATFDPNAYKPQIIQIVKEKKQRTLRLDGDIKLAFWPSLGADLGKLALSEFRSEKEFLAVESARVSLKLMPLLAKQAVVDEVTIKGVRANLVRFKDGRMNFDDLLGKEGQKEKGKQEPEADQVKFDIDHVVIENAALNFRDDMKGAQYSLSGFNLKTGRIAPGVPSKIELSLTVQANQPKVNLNAALKTRLTFDLDQQVYSLEDLGLEAKGHAADIANLVAKASGSVVARLKAGEFSSSKLSVSVTGVRGKDNLDIKIEAPRLDLTADKASGDKVAVVAKVTGPQSALAASLNLPSIEGTSSAFKSPGMTLDLDVKQGERAMKAKLASPITGNLQARQVSLPQLRASITASGSNLPGKALSGELSGSANIDAGKGNAQANLAGKVADSTIKARLNVANLAHPSIGFDLDIDQLDLDRYLPPKPAAGGAGAAGAKKAEAPFDLSGLRNVRANGTVRIGSLKAQNLKAANVRLDIKANNGRVDVNPLAANLYQGSLSGAVSINAAPATPTVFRNDHRPSATRIRRRPAGPRRRAGAGRIPGRSHPVGRPEPGTRLSPARRPGPGLRCPEPGGHLPRPREAPPSLRPVVVRFRDDVERGRRRTQGSTEGQSTRIPVLPHPDGAVPSAAWRPQLRRTKMRPPPPRLHGVCPERAPRDPEGPVSRRRGAPDPSHRSAQPGREGSRLPPRRERDEPCGETPPRESGVHPTERADPGSRRSPSL